MPELRKTEYTAEVVWLGHVPSGDSIRAKAVETLEFGFDGDPGARHQGTTRASCVRVKNLHPVGVQIRNSRQLTILSAEELAEIASGMDLDSLDPALLGASMVVRGIPDFTHVPPSSRLQAPSGLTVVVDLENLPCIIPGRKVESVSPGHGPKFKPAAKGKRGVTAGVERPGSVRVGDTLTLFVPDQRGWAPQSG